MAVLLGKPGAVAACMPVLAIVNTARYICIHWHGTCHVGSYQRFNNVQVTSTVRTTYGPEPTQCWTQLSFASNLLSFSIFFNCGLTQYIHSAYIAVQCTSCTANSCPATFNTLITLTSSPCDTYIVPLSSTQCWSHNIQQG
jgi:hypothetical protein